MLLPRVSCRYVKAGDNYEEAELAQMRMERKLQAAQIGAFIPEETVNSSHRIADVIAAYLAALRESRRPAKSIKAKEAELKRFAQWARKEFVEEISRGTLIAYRNYLYEDQHLSSVTVLNNVMSVVTWLKNNPTISITKLLKKEDWDHEYCAKPDTEPNPYSEDELQRMTVAATATERLLLRFFLATGCREQEVAQHRRIVWPSGLDESDSGRSAGRPTVIEE